MLIKQLIGKHWQIKVDQGSCDPRRPNNYFSSAETDLKTNCPTLEFVIMQKSVQLEGSFTPDSLTRVSASLRALPSYSRDFYYMFAVHTVTFNVSLYTAVHKRQPNNMVLLQSV